MKATLSSRLSPRSRVKASAVPERPSSVPSKSAGPAPLLLRNFSDIPVYSSEELAHASERSIRGYWRPGEPIPAFVQKALHTSSQPLTPELRSRMEEGFRSDFKDVRIHTNEEASESANRLGAAAYTAGKHIVFGSGQYAPGTETGDHLLRHELAHASQQRSSAEASTMSRDDPSERFADSWSNHWPQNVPLPSSFPPAAIRPSVASKIIKWAAKKLEKRTAKLISKHIARHARAIAGRAVHSIFKNPRQIRALMKVTLKEAGEVAARHAGAGTERVVEEAGIRLTRQATGTPGKFRLVIDRVFQKEIGTAGERILRIVLDKSGRIVTAFPTDRLLMLGLTAAGLEVLTSGTAEAGGVVRDQAERQAAVKEREEEESSSWWEWIPIIGDIWGGSLNVGEAEALKESEEERQIEKLIQQTIEDIEKTEQRSFDREHRQEIEDIIRTAITTPGIVEEAEEGEGE